jgi:hypothetical protein
MSIIKSTTQLKKLLEREGQIQTTLTSLMPGVRVEDAAHCVLSSGVRGGGTLASSEALQPRKAIRT